MNIMWKTKHSRLQTDLAGPARKKNGSKTEGASNVKGMEGATSVASDVNRVKQIRQESVISMQKKRAASHLLSRATPRGAACQAPASAHRPGVRAAVCKSQTV